MPVDCIGCMCTCHVYIRKCVEAHICVYIHVYKHANALASLSFLRKIRTGHGVDEEIRNTRTGTHTHTYMHKD